MSQPNSEQTSELTLNARALAPDFKVLGELGRGGMGIVYLAIDVNLDREVAIKVLPAHLTEPSGVRDRFLREARTSAKLSHPNIVPVYRADEKDGVVFFVMRHVDGESLAERLASSGPLSPLDAARVLGQVALALDYAHARGVIHRDIKPENILLERGSNSAVVTDFGIARLMEAAPQTATGQVLGTVHYMSPEQVLGERVDGRSDVYSLGVVGFKAVTGQLPFAAKSATAVLVEHVMKEPPTVRSIGPGVPEKLAGIIDRCLAKDPAARYQTAGELATALDDATRFIPQSSAAVVTPESKEPRIISEREAKALWSRAAELQSETGVQTSLRSPPPSLGPPTTEDRRTLTSGYRLSDVHEAATEVGIPERYVARAQSELGLNTSGADRERSSSVATRTGAGTAVASRRFGQNIFLGAPTKIVCEVEVPKEVSPEDLEMLALMVQRTIGDPGHVSSLGRSLHWSSAQQQRRLQISIVPRNGRTVIRADESLQPLAGGLFGGIVGGGGGGVGGGVGMPLGIALTHSPLVGLGFFGAAVISAYLVARTLFVSIRRKRERELSDLLRDMAAHIGGDR
ncbi:MAG TPA: serine/threonine-protein kinase [Gemmatimonadaceae bacterium]